MTMKSLGIPRGSFFLLDRIPLLRLYVGSTPSTETARYCTLNPKPSESMRTCVEAVGLGIRTRSSGPPHLLRSALSR